MEEAKRSFAWYAKRLTISLSTAKRYGKPELKKMCKRQDENNFVELPELIEKGLSKGLKNINALGKKQISFFNDDALNEETKKIGILLLNRSMHGLKEAIDSEKLDYAQRVHLMLGVSKMILNAL